MTGAADGEGVARMDVAVSGGGPAGQEAVVDRLRALLGERLGRIVGDDENFFDAGLDSLALIELHATWTAACGLELPATTLFVHPNLAAVAALLDPAAAGPVLAPGGRRGGDRVLRAGAARRGARQRARRGDDA